jgi:hypothetical protein
MPEHRTSSAACAGQARATRTTALIPFSHTVELLPIPVVGIFLRQAFAHYNRVCSEAHGGGRAQPNRSFREARLARACCGASSAGAGGRRGIVALLSGEGMGLYLVWARDIDGFVEWIKTQT